MVFLHLLGADSFLFLDAATEGAAISGFLFLDGCCAGLLNVFLRGPVNVLLKDRLNVNALELGLEVPESFGGGVGSTARVGEVVSVVLGFVAVSSPF